MRVAFSRQAEAQLDALELYIAAMAADPATAESFVDRIVARRERIADVPRGGTPREDLGREFRPVAFERSTVIIYRVRKDTIAISGIFYGGQDLSRHYRGRSR